MNEPARASYRIQAAAPGEVFAALSDVWRFGEWSFGLKSARVLEAPDAAPSGRLVAGSTVEFVLSAAGLTHRVESFVTDVEPPRFVRWRYTKGAIGGGGWTVEEAEGGAVCITLHTDYEVRPAWLNRLAHRPLFRGITEDLPRRSMRRFAECLAEG